MSIPIKKKRSELLGQSSPLPLVLTCHMMHLVFLIRVLHILSNHKSLSLLAVSTASASFFLLPITVDFMSSGQNPQKVEDNEDECQIIFSLHHLLGTYIVGSKCHQVKAD